MVWKPTQKQSNFWFSTSTFGYLKPIMSRIFMISRDAECTVKDQVYSWQSTPTPISLQYQLVKCFQSDYKQLMTWEQYAYIFGK